MRTSLKAAVLATALVVMLLGDLRGGASLRLSLVPDAQAIIGLPFTPLSFAGVARRTAFRTVAWTGAASAAAATSAATAEAAAAQQQAAAAQAQAAAAEQRAAAAAAPPPPPAAPPPAAAAGQPLPIGTIVQTLPAGCVSTPVAGVDYFYCGGNFYRAAFSGNNLVYVTAKP